LIVVQTIMISQTRDIHWRAPSSVVLALAVGILFAFAHHLFYSSLANTLVPKSPYFIAGIAASPQQVNIAAGTALAFLVKSCLVSAVVIAYTQVFWNAFLDQPTRLPSLDTAFSAPGNAFTLFFFGMW
jgi:hypothetical protein